MHNNGNRVRGRRRPNKNGQCFKSNGPDHIIRGQAIQIAQKYKELAVDAEESEKENLLQHAHHWQSVHNTNRAQPVG
jgi:hypothetical protein